MDNSIIEVKAYCNQWQGQLIQTIADIILFVVI